MAWCREVPVPPLGLGEAVKDSKSAGCCRGFSGALPGKLHITDDSEREPRSSCVVCCRRAPSFGVLSSSASEIPGWFDWAIGWPPLCFWKGSHFLTANEKPNGHLKWSSKPFCWGGLQFFAVFTVFRPDYKARRQSSEDTQTSEDFHVAAICRVFANSLWENKPFRSKKMFQVVSEVVKTPHSDWPFQKNLHLLLALRGSEASKRGTWPLKTRQNAPTWKNSDVCAQALFSFYK